MKYGLVLYKNQYQFQTINGFSTFKGFEQLDETSLDDIISFTQEFIDEESLRIFLIENGLLKNYNFKSQIGIIQYRDRENQKLFLESVPLATEKKFFDMEYLKKYFQENMTEPSFMKAFLLKCHEEKLDDVPVFREPLNYLKSNYRNALENEYTYNRCIEMLNQFIEIYTRRKTKEGSKISFNRYTNLAMFAISYERCILDSTIIKGEENDELNDLLQEMEYYSELLRNEDVLEEEKEAYERHLQSIKSTIQYHNKGEVSKRRYHEFTKN